MKTVGLFQKAFPVAINEKARNTFFLLAESASAFRIIGPLCSIPTQPLVAVCGVFSFYHCNVFALLSSCHVLLL